MSLFKHYIVFGLLAWLAVSSRLDGFERMAEIGNAAEWVIGGLLLTAAGITVYVLRVKRKAKRKNGDNSPLL